jgi:hypothetical protein
VPWILAVDFTHQLVDRDCMFQALLRGVPASTALTTYPPSCYRRLGAITRAIHDVRGTRFGSVVDPAFATWSEAVRDLFYQARHLTGVRLDIHRRGLDIGTVPPVHWHLGDVLVRLGG